MPDTGATATIISSALARTYGYKPIASQDTLSAANGQRMQCDGRLLLQIQANGRTVEVNAIATPHLRDDLLISWHDLQRLGVISENFPKIQDTCSAVNIPASVPQTNSARTDNSCAACQAPLDSVEQIMENFKDVLSDELRTKPMSGSTMHIFLKDGVKIVPRRVLTARKVPIAMQIS